MRRRTLLGILLAGAVALLPAVAFADTEITTANSSEDSEVSSGDASSHNSGTAQVGHSGGSSTQDGASTVDESDDAQGADIVNNQADNVQEGDNELEAEQNATASSGDTVGGQVIGAVVEGNLTADATNLSSDVDLSSGDADSDNNFAAFVGLTSGSSTNLGAADDILNNTANNVQAGDNSSDILQNTDASSGDAVGGQIFGGTVTGTVDAVLANTSEDTDADSGDADESSDIGQFTGLQASGVIQIV
jgi:hypothetical protein